MARRRRRKTPNLHRVGDGLEPGTARAALRAIRAMQAAVSVAALESALRRGDKRGAIKALGLRDAKEAMAPLRSALKKAVVQGIAAVGKTL
jgi:hypothetical protein